MVYHETQQWCTVILNYIAKKSLKKIFEPKLWKCFKLSREISKWSSSIQVLFRILLKRRGTWHVKCEVNAEVSRSHSNEASSSSTTRTIGCFQTFRAIGPNILKCQYQMSSNILKCHILQWSILLWPICLCHNRVCIILICKEVKGTITIHLDIIVVNSNLLS